MALFMAISISMNLFVMPLAAVSFKSSKHATLTLRNIQEDDISCRHAGRYTITVTTLWLQSADKPVTHRSRMDYTHHMHISHTINNIILQKQVMHRYDIYRCCETRNDI